MTELGSIRGSSARPRRNWPSSPPTYADVSMRFSVLSGDSCRTQLDSARLLPCASQEPSGVRGLRDASHVPSARREYRAPDDPNEIHKYVILHISVRCSSNFRNPSKE